MFYLNEDDFFNEANFQSRFEFGNTDKIAHQKNLMLLSKNIQEFLKSLSISNETNKLNEFIGFCNELGEFLQHGDSEIDVDRQRYILSLFLEEDEELDVCRLAKEILLKIRVTFEKSNVTAYDDELSSLIQSANELAEESLRFQTEDEEEQEEEEDVFLSAGL